MTEAVRPHTFSDLSPETRLTYRALCRDEALYGDSLAIIRGCPTQEAAATALARWIWEEETPTTTGLGLYAQLLSLTLEHVNWLAVVTAFTPEDDHALASSDISPVTRSLPTGE
jgi:hypothetical protein